MFFVINGVAVYRFKKPVFWFVWFVQIRPFSLVLYVLALISSFATVLSTITFVVVVTDSIMSGKENAFGLSQIGTLSLFFGLLSLILMRAYSAISQRRHMISQGNYRQFYVIKRHYSYSIILNDALNRPDTLPPEVLASAFDDPAIMDADQRLRLLEYTSVQDLQLIRQLKKRVLYMVQATLLRNGKATSDALRFLVVEHNLVAAVINQYAHTLLESYERRKETLIEFINETQENR